MTDAKAPAPQTNVRAPIEARDTLLRIGGLLRSDPDFLPKLQSFLDGYEGVSNDPTLPERIEDLERHMAAIKATAMMRPKKMRFLDLYKSALRHLLKGKRA